MGPQTPTPSTGLQQPPVFGIIYSQVGLPYYGMSQPQPSYTYPQPNPIYPNLGYNIGGKTPWQPQAQMPQPSFQQVAYPGFGQQKPQVFAYQNNPYLGYQQKIPYVGAQRPVSQAMPSYPGYSQPYLNRQLPFVATL